jgi:multidrug efflux pump subunit AcrB
VDPAAEGGRGASAVTWLEERYARILAWTFRHKAWTTAIVAAAMVVGFLPFMLKLIETSTFSGSVNRRIGINYEFADFTYKSDAEKTVS